MPDLLPLDPKCPWCRKDHDVGEIFDGHEAYCAHCDRRIVAVDCGGHMEMARGEPCSDERTGRQRTRARWQKRGRR